jgi:4-oxalocrotonate tautomerase
MPIVQITLLPGRSPEKKAEIAREITRVMHETGGAASESTSVIFAEIPATDWMIGGQMLSDMTKPSDKP